MNPMRCPRSDAHLRRIEHALLDAVAPDKRAAAVRRMVAALGQAEARELIAELARRPDAPTWLAGLRDVA